MSTIPRMNRTRVAFAAASIALALLAGSSALAQEGEEKEVPIKETADYKSAEAWLKKIDAKIYSPFGNGLKTASFCVTQAGGRAGGSVKATFTYDSTKEDPDEAWEVDLDLSELPEQVRGMFEQFADRIKGQMRGFGQWAIDTPYSFVLRRAKKVAYKEDAEANSVVIDVTTPGGEGKDTEMTLNFLLDKVMPVDQIIHQGEQDIRFVTKTGEVHGKTVQVGADLEFPQGTLNVTLKHDKIDGFVVPISYTMKTPQGEQTIEFTDWVMNGKKAEVKTLVSDEAALATMRKIDGSYASMRDFGTGTVSFDMKMPGAGLQGSTCSVTWKEGAVSFDIDLTGAYARFKTQLMKSFKPAVDDITKWVVGQKLADWEATHAVTFAEGGGLRFDAKSKGDGLQAIVVKYTAPEEGPITIESLTFTTSDGASVSAQPFGSVVGNGKLAGKIAMNKIVHTTPRGTVETLIAWSAPVKVGDDAWDGPFVTEVTMDGKKYAISNVKFE
jgi:hypothetical protein